MTSAPLHGAVPAAAGRAVVALGRLVALAGSLLGGAPGARIDRMPGGMERDLGVDRVPRADPASIRARHFL